VTARCGRPTACLTGAEIDAARAGWSFDARTSVALAYALAVIANAEPPISDVRIEAIRQGLSPDELTVIERMVAAILCKRAAHHG
jgi:hypothetical protein